MSANVDGTPISMWDTEDLRKALNCIVSTPQYPRTTLIIAEAVVRALDLAIAQSEKP